MDELDDSPTPAPAPPPSAPKATKPRCPKCGSTNLWDDNFWTGCSDCSWIHSMIR